MIIIYICQEYEYDTYILLTLCPSYICIYIYGRSPVLRGLTPRIPFRSDWIAGLVGCPVHAELQRCQAGRADGGRVLPRPKTLG